MFDQPIPELRARSVRKWGLARAPGGVSVEPVTANGVSAEWLIPVGAAPEGVLLYFHGGGFVFCSTVTHRPLVSRLAATAGVRALSIDYRLAPEHPFPAAVEDTVASYRWLLGNGVSPSKIVLGGDSAGGNLALVTLLALRDAGDPLPAGAFCISPVTDLTGSLQSRVSKAEADPILSHGSGRWVQAYVGEADPRQPLLSPLNADLHGLPPLLIQVGTEEILLDDSTLLVEKALQAGVDARLEVYQGMFHVFQALASFLPESNQAVIQIGEFIQERTRN